MVALAWLSWHQVHSPTEHISDHGCPTTTMPLCGLNFNIKQLRIKVGQLLAFFNRSKLDKIFAKTALMFGTKIVYVVISKT